MFALDGGLAGRSTPARAFILQDQTSLIFPAHLAHGLCISDSSRTEMRYARNRINSAKDPSEGLRALSRISGKTRRMVQHSKSSPGSLVVL
jgi:hypothetical protein